jgi:hypothetical protein
MKLVLKKAVIGNIQGKNETRLHANAGDVLFILLRNPTHYICDSLYYPNEHVIVFKSQIEREIEDDIPSHEEQTFVDEFPLSGGDIPGDLGELIEGGDVSTGY